MSLEDDGNQRYGRVYDSPDEREIERLCKENDILSAQFSRSEAQAELFVDTIEKLSARIVSLEAVRAAADVLRSQTQFQLLRLNNDEGLTPMFTCSACAVADYDAAVAKAGAAGGKL